MLVRIRGGEGTTRHFELHEGQTLRGDVRAFCPLLCVLEVYPQNAQHEEVHEELPEGRQREHRRCCIVRFPLHRHVECDAHNRLAANQLVPESPVLGLVVDPTLDHLKRDGCDEIVTEGNGNHSESGENVSPTVAQLLPPSWLEFS